MLRFEGVKTSTEHIFSEKTEEQKKRTIPRLGVSVLRRIQDHGLYNTHTSESLVRLEYITYYTIAPTRLPIR